MQVLVVCNEHAIRCIQSTINERGFVDITIAGVPWTVQMTPQQAVKFGAQLMSQAHDAEDKQNIVKEVLNGKVKRTSSKDTVSGQQTAEPGRRDEPGHQVSDVQESERRAHQRDESELGRWAIPGTGRDDPP